MSLSTLNNSFIPYSLSGLSNINTDTINGTSPFNGVISNTFYPLSFNTSTGILSQTPINQNININASPTFERVNFNNVNQYIRNVSGGLTIYGNNSITVASGNTLNFLGGQIVFTGTLSGTSGGLMFNANANISCGSGLDLIFTTIDTADNILFVSGTTQKFKINSSGIYAPSLSSVSQTYLLGYNTSTGQITYQSPPSVPLSITVNNIASDSSNNLSLSSANNNVNITALSAIGGTGSGNIILDFQRFLSFNNNGVEVARIDTSNGRLIFPNLSSISAYNTPIYFSGTGTNYIASGASTLGFFTGNNTFSISPTPSGEMLAKINNVTILKINSTDGLTTSLITSTSNLTLNTLSSVAILFNIASSNVGYIGTDGLYINQIISKTPVDDLQLNSQSGIITTGSSLTMNGGNINIYDYSTRLIQSQLFTENTGLILKTATTKDIRFRIASTDIANISASGLIMNSSLPISSATNTNLILNCPSVGYQMNLQHAGTTKCAITTNGLTIWNNNLYNAGASLNIRNSTASTAYITLGNMDSVNNTFIQFVNSSGNNAGYIQSTYATPTISQLAINSTGNIDLNASSTGSINLNVGSTLLSIGSAVIATLGNVNIGGTGRFTGLLTQDFPVNVYYQSSQTGPSNTVYVATGGFFTANGLNLNSSMPSYVSYAGVNYISNNWTPVWGTTSANYAFLYFPYTGVYTIDWSASFRSNINAMITINKNYNLANWSISVPQNDSTMLNKCTMSPNTSYDLSCSATVRINVAGSDYVCFSIYNFSGAALFQLNAFRSMLNINKVG